MWVFRSFLILVIIGIIIGFALSNSGLEQNVDIDLIWAKRYNVPILTVVLWSFISGALVSWLLFVSVYLKQSTQLNKANREIKGYRDEVTALRNRPIEETKNLLEKKNGLRE
ncbi:MAG: hypothetical protein DRP51_00440 [Candidatus Zixiibacteriota bacterium]|nr:MAG: hypothetical protein DRP51_00440 [candidate division Zixibacteria bacterium]